MQVGNDRIEAMGRKRRHEEEGTQVTVADLGEAGLFAHGSAGRMLFGHQTGIGSELGSLAELSNIDFCQKATSGEAADARNGEEQFNLLSLVRVLGEEFVQLLFEELDFLVEKVDRLLNGAPESRRSHSGAQLVALALPVFLQRGNVPADFLAFSLNEQRRRPEWRLLPETEISNQLRIQPVILVAPQLALPIGVNPGRVDHAHLEALGVQKFSQRCAIATGRFQADMQFFYLIRRQPLNQILETLTTVAEARLLVRLIVLRQCCVKTGLGDVDPKNVHLVPLSQLLPNSGCLLSSNYLVIRAHLAGPQHFVHSRTEGQERELIFVTSSLTAGANELHRSLPENDRLFICHFSLCVNIPALASVICHIKNHPACGQVVLDAFDHDIDFPNHIDDPEFQFEYNTALDDTTRNVLKVLMVAFYEDLLYDGFPGEVHGVPQKFSRDSVLQRFWSANSGLNVCPACDGQRPDSIGMKNYADVDHYLPKSSYSFLSIHPVNLVPVCRECNSSFKLVRDPVDKANDAPLVNIFVPYLRAALGSVTVKTSRSNDGALQFEVIDNDGSRSRRVKNLVRTYRLEERWPSRESQIKGSIVEELQTARRRLARYGENPDAVQLRLEIDDMLESKITRIGRNHNYILHASYLSFASGNQDESDELLRQFEGR